MVVNNMLDWNATAAILLIGDDARKLFYRDVLAEAGVENLAVALFTQAGSGDKARTIFDKEQVARLRAVALDEQRLALQIARDEDRHHAAFHIALLKWAVGIERPDDFDGQTV